jgi:hypothetical protein
MVKLYALLMAALFAGLTLAAPPKADAPDPAAAPAPGHPGCPMMKQAQDQPGPGMGMRMEGKGMCPMGMDRMPCRRAFCGPLGGFLPRCCACCVLAILAVVLFINVLLTVLVVRDMAVRNAMNGLWVPLLLVAGIPVTALYALFRIGDNLKALEDKRV